MTSPQTCSELLVNLEPLLCPEIFIFERMSGESPATLDREDLFALIRESEGITVIRAVAPEKELQTESLQQFAKITLQVCSDLDAVGLTAAVARALTDINMCANVVAAALHDHIFVPYARRLEALECLQALSASAQAQSHNE